MTKDTTFKLRISEADLAVIKGKAAAAGMSTAEFIRICCEEREVPGYVPTDDSLVEGQLSFSDYGIFS